MENGIGNYLYLLYRINIMLGPDKSMIPVCTFVYRIGGIFGKVFNWAILRKNSILKLTNVMTSSAREPEHAREVRLDHC